jgi:hypothetical protein
MSTSPISQPASLKVLSCNVSCKQGNNVFEFWNSESKVYDLVCNVHYALQSPKQSLDCMLVDIFPESMMGRFAIALTATALGTTPYYDAVKIMYDRYLTLKNQSVLSILSSKQVGKKRLVSMPDRFNPNRPAVTTSWLSPGGVAMDAHLFSDSDAWLGVWFAYVLDKHCPYIAGRDNARYLLSREKYPALSQADVDGGLPLQLLYLLIYDLTTIHVFNHVKDTAVWSKIRRDAVLSAAFRDTQMWTLLKKIDADVVCCQEMSARDQEDAEKMMPGYWVVTDCKHAPEQAILLRKSLFSEPPLDLNDSGSESPNAIGVHTPGLLLVPVRLPHSGLIKGQPQHLWVGSFHGDSDGRSTRSAIDTVKKIVGPNPFVGGFDTNWTQDKMEDLCDILLENNLNSGGLRLDTVVNTTFKGRTPAQPQFHKATAPHDFSGFDRSPKDHIICSFEPFSTIDDDEQRINTADLGFSDSPFPTATFPFDHAWICQNLCINDHAGMLMPVAESLRLEIPPLNFGKLERQPSSSCPGIPRRSTMEEDYEPNFEPIDDICS